MQQTLFPNFKKYTCQGLAALGIVASCCQTAGAASLFLDANGWTQIANDDDVRSSDGYVNPGYGGQDFDAEYLAYRLVGNTLSIGLQAGYDLVDGHIITGGINYYAGDLALSFDETPATYEYAFDFGLETKDYDNPGAADISNFVDVGTGDGIDPMGLYRDITWNNGVYKDYLASNPFAMDAGTMVTGASGTTSFGYNSTEDSYWRIVSFNIASLSITDDFTLGAHWTMSCGNDVIGGSANVPVPEPATMLLFGTGIAGLVGSMRRRKLNKK